MNSENTLQVVAARLSTLGNPCPCHDGPSRLVKVESLAFSVGGTTLWLGSQTDKKGTVSTSNHYSLPPECGCSVLQTLAT